MTAVLKLSARAKQIFWVSLGKHPRDVGKKGKCIRTAVYGYAWIAAIRLTPACTGNITTAQTNRPSIVDE